MKKTVLTAVFLFALIFCKGQDLDYVTYVVDTLCSPSMHGRGYVKKGDKIAAGFIRDEFVKMGIKHFGEDYFQPFNININTFPKKISLTIGDKTLQPGTDFIVHCSSPSVKGKYSLYYVPEDYQSSDEVGVDLSRRFLLGRSSTEKAVIENPLDAKGIIYINEDPLWWHVSNGQFVDNMMTLKVREESLPHNAKTVSVKIKNKFLKNYETQNVIGYVKGKSHPERFIVFTAHYDHLGMMGSETYWPGAHDNASGTAMIMDLARHYALPENQPDYSIAFIAFGAEEVGLLGSAFYNNNPVFPLENIRFLVNLDMISTGVDGIIVVNGKVLEIEYQNLVAINDENKLLKGIKSRGTARNSDHYYFYENGVPSFFIYTLGDYPYYHRTDDIPENLPFTEYKDLFTLMTLFTKALEN